jgi:hypothetical protein
MLILRFKNAEQKLKERVEKQKASRVGLAFPVKILLLNFLQ